MTPREHAHAFREALLDLTVRPILMPVWLHWAIRGVIGLIWVGGLAAWIWGG